MKDSTSGNDEICSSWRGVCPPAADSNAHITTQEYNILNTNTLSLPVAPKQTQGLSCVWISKSQKTSLSSKKKKCCLF